MREEVIGATVTLVRNETAARFQIKTLKREDVLFSYNYTQQYPKSNW